MHLATDLGADELLGIAGIAWVRVARATTRIERHFILECSEKSRV